MLSGIVRAMLMLLRNDRIRRVDLRIDVVSSWLMHAVRTGSDREIRLVAEDDLRVQHREREPGRRWCIPPEIPRGACPRHREPTRVDLSP